MPAPLLRAPETSNSYRSSYTTCPIVTVLPRLPTENSQSPTTVWLITKTTLTKLLPKSNVSNSLFIIKYSIHKNDWIEYPDVRVVAVVEPDSIANLVTNLSVQKCAEAQATYMVCLGREFDLQSLTRHIYCTQTAVEYAIKQLATVGVYMYLDAGHAGWLGWPANLTPAAQLFAQVCRSIRRNALIHYLLTRYVDLYGDRKFPILPRPCD